MNVVETPTLYTITMTDADTEYSQLLPSSTRKIRFQCRTANDVRYAYVTGKVAGSTAPFSTLKSGAVYTENDLDLSGVTLYVACAAAAKVVELEVWT